MSNPPKTAGANRPRFCWNVFIVVFLGIQLLLPIRGFVLDKYETRGHFSWNMYSKRYRCHVRYRLLTPRGRFEEIAFKNYFNRPSRAPMIYHRDVLPEFHAFLCDQLRRDGRAGGLRGTMSCLLDSDPHPRDLILEGVDICSRPDYGVPDR